MKKLVGVIALALLLGFTGNVLAKDVTIALVPKGLDNPVFEPVRVAAEEEAKKQGVKFLWEGPAKSETQAQIAVVDGLIKKGVDAIGISVNDVIKLNPVITKAVEAGIVVSTWDSDAQGSKRAFYLGTDNYKAGFQCGEEMKKLIGPNKKVAALSGGPTAFNLNERIRGFVDAVKGSNIQIVTVLYCYDDVEAAANLVETYTGAYAKDLDGWFFVGGWPLWIPVEKMENLKKFEGKTVCLDYWPSAKPWVEQGLVDVCIAQNFPAMGSLSVQNLANVVKNGATYPENNDSGVLRIDKSNLADN